MGRSMKNKYNKMSVIGSRWWVKNVHSNIIAAFLNVWNFSE